MLTVGHIVVSESELEWSFVRSEGPGGQNVNKTASKAVLRWNVEVTTALSADVKARLCVQQKNRITTDGDLVISSQRFRDQERNRQDCLDKLCEIIKAAAKKPKKRVATKPTASSREARLEGKKHRRKLKDFRRTPDY